MTTPLPDHLTPNNIVKHLSALARELDSTVEALRDADIDAVLKRHAADLAESRAFVMAEGSVDLRRHTARMEAAEEEEAAVVAEALVRNLRQRIRAIEARIDTGRTMSAALRAELNTLGGRGA